MWVHITFGYVLLGNKKLSLNKEKYFFYFIWGISEFIENVFLINHNTRYVYK